MRRFFVRKRAHDVLLPFVLANPASGMIELFRVAFLGPQPYSFLAMWIALAWTVVLVFFSAVIYRRFDRLFADLL